MWPRIFPGCPHLFSPHFFGVNEEINRHHRIDSFQHSFLNYLGLPRWHSGKESTCLCRRFKRQVRSLDWDDPLEEEMATLSSILAWTIPWTEEPGGLQSKGSQRVGHDWTTEHVSNENLLYGTGNSTQFFSDKEGIYAYMELIPIAVQQKLTQHRKATILQ